MLLVDFLRTLAKSPSFIVCSLILYFLGENLPSGLWLALHSYIVVLLLVNTFRILAFPPSNNEEISGKARGFRVVVIGSGFGGLCALYKLLAAGVTDVIVLEKAQTPGGVWRDNVYPGAACDINSHLYCFSFFQNPWWSQAFCTGEEILAYIMKFIAQFDLAKHIRYDQQVESCQWDSIVKLWKVTTNRQVIDANVIIQATGRLHVPYKPKYKDASSFTKPMFHSAEWDTSVDLTDKRVAVVGTGASAVQIVPSLAKTVKQLYVFQRKPAWVPYRANFHHGWFLKQLFSYVPFLNTVGYYLFFGTGTPGSTLAKKISEEMMVRNLDGDPRLTRELVPKFPLGCKRTTPSDTYLQAFTRPNVSLVTDDISSLNKTGIVCTSGASFDVDAIVLATGFDAVANAKPFVVYGIDADTSMHAEWKEQPSAHLGVTYPGYPNYFMILGPNSGVLRGSILYLIECQTDYILDCLRCLGRRNKDAMDLSAIKMEDYKSWLDAESKKVSKRSAECPEWFFSGGKASWMRWSQWPADLVTFWWRTRQCNEEDYRYA